MTDASLIHRGADAPRQTHVLLVGLGTYPHLRFGGGKAATDDFGLAQLTSPPASARALADWFITAFDCADRPLGTVRLLVSERTPSVYRHPTTGVEQPIPGPDVVAMRAAFQAWAEGAANTDDQLILYFCGHGLSGGLNEFYPLQDFGLDAAADDGPLARAINLNKLAGGLMTVRASNQLLIFDTCREQDQLVEANQDGGAGFVTARPQRRIGVPEKMAQCVIHSTEPDTRAGGPGGQPSVCAEALMRVLAGAGANRSGGIWQVKSMAISNAITELQDRKSQPAYARQRSDQSRAANLVVRRFTTAPRVPVFIRRRDGAALGGATIDYCAVGGSVPVREIADGVEWEGAVPAGSHRFIVSHGGPPPALDVEEPVSPIFVELEVP